MIYEIWHRFGYPEANCVHSATNLADACLMADKMCHNGLRDIEVRMFTVMDYDSDGFLVYVPVQRDLELEVEY